MKKSLLLVLALGLSLGLEMVTALPLASANEPASLPVNAVWTHNSAYFIISSDATPDATIYYNTDGVIQDVTNLLMMLGATHVQVTVDNGAMDQVIMNPSVNVTFDSLRLPSASVTGAQIAANWQTVTLQDQTNGNLISQTLNSVQNYFELRGLTGSASGVSADPGYSYSLTTLFPQSSQ